MPNWSKSSQRISALRRRLTILKWPLKQAHWRGVGFMLLLMVPDFKTSTLDHVFRGLDVVADVLFVCALSNQEPGDFHEALAGRPNQRRPLLLVLHVLVPTLQQTLLQLFDVPLLNRLLKLVSPVPPLRTDHRFQIFLRLLRRKVHFFFLSEFFGH